MVNIMGRGMTKGLKKPEGLLKESRAA